MLALLDPEPLLRWLLSSQDDTALFASALEREREPAVFKTGSRVEADDLDHVLRHAGDGVLLLHHFEEEQLIVVENRKAAFQEELPELDSVALSHPVHLPLDEDPSELRIGVLAMLALGLLHDGVELLPLLHEALLLLLKGSEAEQQLMSTH